jgi:hypothetical protein
MTFHASTNFYLLKPESDFRCVCIHLDHVLNESKQLRISKHEPCDIILANSMNEHLPDTEIPMERVDSHTSSGTSASSPSYVVLA